MANIDSRSYIITQNIPSTKVPQNVAFYSCKITQNEADFGKWMAEDLAKQNTKLITIQLAADPTVYYIPSGANSYISRLAQILTYNMVKPFKLGTNSMLKNHPNYAYVGSDMVVHAAGLKLLPTYRYLSPNGSYYEID